MIGPLVTNGFILHNAQDNRAVLYKWLNKKRKDIVHVWSPGTISIIAAIVKDDKVLVVKEKSARKNGWKFVTGHVDFGESLEDAVVREVKEETGLDVCVKGLINVRHLTRFKYGNHDFSFLLLF